MLLYACVILGLLLAARFSEATRGIFKICRSWCKISGTPLQLTDVDPAKTPYGILMYKSSIVDYLRKAYPFSPPQKPKSTVILDSSEDTPLQHPLSYNEEESSHAALPLMQVSDEKDVYSFLQRHYQRAFNRPAQLTHSLRAISFSCTLFAFTTGLHFEPADILILLEVIAFMILLLTSMGVSIVFNGLEEDNVQHSIVSLLSIHHAAEADPLLPLTEMEPTLVLPIKSSSTVDDTDKENAENFTVPRRWNLRSPKPLRTITNFSPTSPLEVHTEVVTPIKIHNAWKSVHFSDTEKMSPYSVSPISPKPMRCGTKSPVVRRSPGKTSAIEIISPCKMSQLESPRKLTGASISPQKPVLTMKTSRLDRGLAQWSGQREGLEKSFSFSSTITTGASMRVVTHASMKFGKKF